MDQLFVAFIIIGIMLEMYELNRSRVVALEKRKMLMAFTSIISVAIIYALFITAGWYASSLLPEMTIFTKTITAAVLVLVLIIYSFLRDRRYNKAGKLIFGNFNLFLLIVVARGIVHLVTGLLLALLAVNPTWLLESYALGVVLFGGGVLMAKGEKVQIFGIAVGYIKIIAFIIAVFLILMNGLW